MQELKRRFTTEQLAEAYPFFRVQTLNTWRSRGTGGPPYVKMDHRVIYREEDIEGWLESRLVMPSNK